MECVIENFDSTIQHTKKRFLKGRRRCEVSKKLVECNMLPSAWRRNEANETMEFGDPEPPTLPSNKVLQKAKQQRKNINLGITSTNPIDSMLQMK